VWFALGGVRSFHSHGASVGGRGGERGPEDSATTARRPPRRAALPLHGAAGPAAARAMAARSEGAVVESFGFVCGSGPAGRM
jgi:hypothetical protein